MDIAVWISENPPLSSQRHVKQIQIVGVKIFFWEDPYLVYRQLTGIMISVSFLWKRYAWLARLDFRPAQCSYLEQCMPGYCIKALHSLHHAWYPKILPVVTSLATVTIKQRHWITSLTVPYGKVHCGGMHQGGLCQNHHLFIPYNEYQPHFRCCRRAVFLGQGAQLLPGGRLAGVLVLRVHDRARRYLPQPVRVAADGWQSDGAQLIVCVCLCVRCVRLYSYY